MTTVSHSEVESWLLCQRRWFYGYARNLERVRTSNALARGILGHAVLATFYQAVKDGATVQEAVELAWKTYEEGWKPDIDDRSHMSLENVLIWYFDNEPYVRRGWQVLAVERDFLVPIGTEPEDEIELPFVIDLVCFDRKGRMVVIDHKFLFDFYGDSGVELQPQIPKYMGGLEEMGQEPYRGEYNMIRTRPLAKTHTAVDRVNQLSLVPTRARIDRTMHEHLVASRQIQAAKALPIDTLEETVLRSANEHICKNCSFRDLCSADLRGSGSDLITRIAYKQRERRQFGKTKTETEDE